LAAFRLCNNSDTGVNNTLYPFIRALIAIAIERWVLPLWKAFHNGKTHLSIAIGLKAIQAGYTVCFERVATLIKLLKMVDIQRKAGFRVNRILKADLIIIDEIGYTPIERKEANLFFNLISELYEKASVIITSNKRFDEWAEMMGDEVMTVAMLDRLLHHSKVFNLSGESFRIQKEEED